MRFFYWCRGPPGTFSFSKMDNNQQTTFSTLKGCINHYEVCQKDSGHVPCDHDDRFLCPRRPCC